MTHPYEVVDVFTERPFTGNPLAVVFNCDDLDTGQLQAIAREFNLSETAFPLPPSSSDATYRLRIFTPSTELPFAGHPSVGAAWLLHATGRLKAGRVVQECGAGLLPLDVSADRVVLTGAEPVVSDPLEAAAFLEAVGLEAAAAVGTPVRWAGTGITWAFLHVVDEALARCAPDLSRLAALGNAGVSVFSFGDRRAHARVFAPAAGVPEDPATGSAALALGVWLVASGLLPGEEETAYVIDQGREMHRPSRLECVVRAAGGRAVECRVAGAAARVARGEIDTPDRRLATG